MSQIESPPQLATGTERRRSRVILPRQAARLTDTFRGRVGEHSLDWIIDLSQLASSDQLPLAVLRDSISELAWLARRAGTPLPTSADYDRCEQASDPDLARLAMAYLHGQRLKGDYRFQALAESSREWLSIFPDDGMIRALAAFAALGSRHEGGQALLTRALGTPDCDRHCRYVCLQGLWFATDLPGQARQLLGLSDDMIGRGEDEHSLYYWRTSALRRLGRLEDALTCVDRAIDGLPVGMNDWHQDYVRERELVITTRFMTEHVQRQSETVGDQLRAELGTYLETVRTESERHSTDARRLVSGSLLSLVEVLGIFVAITGFLIASGAVVFRATSFWESFTAVALLLGGAVTFFVLLRFVVRFQTRR